MFVNTPAGVTGDASRLFNGLWPRGVCIRRPSNSDARHLFMKLNLEPPAESERQMLLLSIYMWGGGRDNRRGPNIDGEPFQTGFEWRICDGGASVGHLIQPLISNSV